MHLAIKVRLVVVRSGPRRCAAAYNAGCDRFDRLARPDIRAVVAVREARRLVASVGEAIDKEEALGSLRHRRVSTAAKALSLICVLAIDLPITLWLSIAVVGLDRARPDAGTVAMCVVAALVATAGVAILPYQLGHDHRTYKTPERQLRLDRHAPRCEGRTRRGDAAHRCRVGSGAGRRRPLRSVRGAGPPACS